MIDKNKEKKDDTNEPSPDDESAAEGFLTGGKNHPDRCKTGDAHGNCSE